MTQISLIEMFKTTGNGTHHGTLTRDFLALHALHARDILRLFPVEFPVVLLVLPGVMLRRPPQIRTRSSGLNSAVGLYPQ